MKKIIALGICLCMAVLVHAQYETTLVVTDAPSTAVKARMEQNGTKLLTELNNAHILSADCSRDLPTRFTSDLQNGKHHR